MIFFLIPLITCDWWDFNEEEFPKIVSNSFLKPLFVLCYSYSCPHCHGLPELLRNFSQNEGNRNDIYFTSIECSTTTYCRHFSVTGTPHLVVVMGPDRKYWLPVPGRNISSWAPFVENILQKKLRPISSEEELLRAKQEPTSGGTTFYLETPSITTQYFQKIQTLSQRYQIYNDTFVYSINPSLSSFKLTAYLSPECGITMKTNENIETFLSQNKFGYLHKYDLQEILDFISQNKAVILITDRPLSTAQKNSFSSLQSHFCQTIRYGWASTSNEPKMLKITGRTNWDLPFLFGSDMQNGCEWIYKGKIKDAFKNGFLEKVQKGKCDENNNFLKNLFNNNFYQFKFSNDRNWIMFIAGIIFFFMGLFTSFISLRHKNYIVKDE